jgi:hypothetical protein
LVSLRIFPPISCEETKERNGLFNLDQNVHFLSIEDEYTLTRTDVQVTRELDEIIDETD